MSSHVLANPTRVVDQYLTRLLGKFGPTRPHDELVQDVNRLYHAAEATTYDQRHPEIFNQLPPIWTQMVEVAERDLPMTGITVLDYGCGTGFAASQVLELLGPNRIRQLICYDPSSEMLDQCRKRLHNSEVAISYCESETGWRRPGERFVNLLLTNSLLHHLHDPVASVLDLRTQIAPSGVWIAGHEPSARFYRNPECAALLRAFDRARRLRLLLSPAMYWRKAAERFGIGDDPASVTARSAYTMGWFQKRPTPQVIGLLVDLHVAGSQTAVAEGRGLDFAELATQLKPTWSLAWHTTYSFLGTHAEELAPAIWRARGHALRAVHPDDGANFCAVWRVHD